MQITPVSSTPGIYVGGEFLPLAGLICLLGYTTNAGGLYATPKVNGAAAGYTPSGTKTFVIHAVRTWGSQANAAISLGFANADVGQASAAPPAGNTLMNGSVPFWCPAQGSVSEYSGLNYQIANGKYVWYTGNYGGVGTCYAQVFGYEV